MANRLPATRDTINPERLIWCDRDCVSVVLAQELYLLRIYHPHNGMEPPKGAATLTALYSCTRIRHENCVRPNKAVVRRTKRYWCRDTSGGECRTRKRGGSFLSAEISRRCPATEQVRPLTSHLGSGTLHTRRSLWHAMNYIPGTACL